MTDGQTVVTMELGSTARSQASPEGTRKHDQAVTTVGTLEACSGPQQSQDPIAIMPLPAKPKPPKSLPPRPDTPPPPDIPQPPPPSAIPKPKPKPPVKRLFLKRDLYAHFHPKLWRKKEAKAITRVEDRKGNSEGKQRESGSGDDPLDPNLAPVAVAQDNGTNKKLGQHLADEASVVATTSIPAIPSHGNVPEKHNATPYGKEEVSVTLRSNWLLPIETWEATTNAAQKRPLACHKDTEQMRLQKKKKKSKTALTGMEQQDATTRTTVMKESTGGSSCTQPAPVLRPDDHVFTLDGSQGCLLEQDREQLSDPSAVEEALLRIALRQARDTATKTFMEEQAKNQLLGGSLDSLKQQQFPQDKSAAALQDNTAGLTAPESKIVPARARGAAGEPLPREILLLRQEQVQRMGDSLAPRREARRNDPCLLGPQVAADGGLGGSMSIVPASQMGANQQQPSGVLLDWQANQLLPESLIDVGQHVRKDDESLQQVQMADGGGQGKPAGSILAASGAMLRTSTIPRENGDPVTAQQGDQHLREALDARLQTRESNQPLLQLPTTATGQGRHVAAAPARHQIMGAGDEEQLRILLEQGNQLLREAIASRRQGRRENKVEPAATMHGHDDAAAEPILAFPAVSTIHRSTTTVQESTNLALRTEEEQHQRRILLDQVNQNQFLLGEILPAVQHGNENNQHLLSQTTTAQGRPAGSTTLSSSAVSVMNQTTTSGSSSKDSTVGAHKERQQQQVLVPHMNQLLAEPLVAGPHAREANQHLQQLFTTAPAAQYLAGGHPSTSVVPRTLSTPVARTRQNLQFLDASSITESLRKQRTVQTEEEKRLLLRATVSGERGLLGQRRDQQNCPPAFRPIERNHPAERGTNKPSTPPLAPSTATVQEAGRSSLAGLPPALWLETGTSDRAKAKGRSAAVALENRQLRERARDLEDQIVALQKRLKEKDERVVGTTRKLTAATATVTPATRNPDLAMYPERLSGKSGEITRDNSDVDVVTTGERIETKVQLKILDRRLEKCTEERDAALKACDDLKRKLGVLEGEVERLLMENQTMAAEVDASRQGIKNCTLTREKLVVELDKTIVSNARKAERLGTLESTHLLLRRQVQGRGLGSMNTIAASVVSYPIFGDGSAV